MSQETPNMGGEQPTSPAVTDNRMMTFDMLDRAAEVETVPMDSSLALYLNPVLFEQGMRAAKVLASSGIMPAHYANNQAACFLLLAMSSALNLNPLMLGQKSYPLNGKFGFEAQAMIALANKSGMFTEPLDWEYVGTGDARAATCFWPRI